MKELVEEMEKETLKTKTSTSLAGDSASVVSHHEKRDFGLCQHSEGRGRTVFKANHIFLLGRRLDREEKGKLNTYFISKTPGTL